MGNADRRDILRGVYEENLRVAGKAAGRPPDRQVVSPPVRKSRLAAFVGALLVFVAGFLFHEFRSSDQAQELMAGTALLGLTAADQSRIVQVEESVPEQEETLLAPQPRREGDLSVARLYDLQVRRIVIDPGHGGRDPGAIGHLGTMEKEITLDIAQRLKERLELYPDYEILLTRDADTRMTNRERVAFANENSADLFISLHVNWLPEEPVTSIETYYFGLRADEETLELAERENLDSDFSVADFRDMIERLGNTVKLQESQRLAVSIQRSLYRNMRQINEGVTDWGVKSAPFVVLLGVEAPSILAEITCISNKEEEIRLNTEEYREQLTGFLEEGIINYLQDNPVDTDVISQGATEYATEED